MSTRPKTTDDPDGGVIAIFLLMAVLIGASLFLTALLWVFNQAIVTPLINHFR